MQLSITQTGEISTFDGVPCRRWEGVGPEPERCRFDVWVHRVHPRDVEGEALLLDCLSAAEPPGRLVPITVSLSCDDLRAYVAQWIVDTYATAYESRTQAALMRLVQTAHEDGEDAIALSLVLLMAARSEGLDGEALSVLSLGLGDLGVDLSPQPLPANAERPDGG